ncbi:BZ3500_MvSof-1268-A1-R1_Chr2-2g04985 [Microbotryum saponariae]|uniref:BZ3500_MvSof-1268-A1-R1_Chr2-2g04985 protein n=1 Tax=Microbotryum saponariae TaxID=289078 RepID=A0A2X0L265_9BASI|nr:BZ3500_MvSof-1268-A1-R1_Chr2-2g04985 [Microbotryum saponariae]SDA00641.1 BZ3501_MvSof-1269-A2-R1_Chr2-2g04659 [Microbotryum saponariae]
MPQTARRPVPLLPLPQLPDDPNAPVFLLKATGEVFLTYEAYSARMTYLLSRIFTCEYSGKSGLDYFQALDSERNESRIVRERFPAELKGKVLKSIQFRKPVARLSEESSRLTRRVIRAWHHTEVMGRLDNLIDQIFERFKDRFFAGEKVFVDLGGDKYYARISSVFPPVAIRNLAREEASLAAIESKDKGKADEDEEVAESVRSSSIPAADALEDFTSYSHTIGTDLHVSTEEALTRDDPDEYLYTVQLMDEEHRFEGSFMEVKAKQLRSVHHAGARSQSGYWLTSAMAFLCSRDRLSFSKSILKRYVRECVHRESTIAAPWIVKPSIARRYNLPMEQSQEDQQRNEEIREAKLAKRRGPTDGDGAPPPKKPRKSKAETDPDAPRKVKAERPPKVPKPPAEYKRAIKYPIEDLDLDPLSIHDGRLLRRVNAEIPPLPSKPSANRHLLVPPHMFDTFISTWNILNVFGKPLNLSPFSLDDFYGAMNHSNPGIRCDLLAEIHASLTNIIGTDTLRVYGSVTVQFVPVADSANEAGQDGEEEGEEEIDELADGDDDEGDVENADPNRIDSELDLLLRKGISYSKRWDRTAKLKSADGREGWERHMIGALCSRGAVRAMPNLHAILKHIFEGADLTPAKLFGAAADSAQSTPAAEQVANFATSNGAASKGKFVDTSDPEGAYLSLPIQDKVDIVAFLATLAMGSKPVRTFLEEAELQLTEYRKARADVNKERKNLLEQRGVLVLEPKTGKPVENAVNALAPPPESGSKAENGEATNGDASSPVPNAANGNHAASVPTSTKTSPAPSPKPELDTAPSSTNGKHASDADATPAAAGSPMAIDDSVAGGDGDEEEDQLADDEDLNEPLPQRPQSALRGVRSPSVASNAESGTGTPALDGHAAYRNRKLLEKQALLGAQEEQMARIRRIAETGTAREKDRALHDIDDQLKKNAKRDDLVEREFRKYHSVSRSKPLGKDRFHCRYWWFDGIGSMELLGKRGEGVLYGTGRLFVQGPSEADYAWMASKAPADNNDIAARRVKEEVYAPGILGTNEWGFYDDEQQIENLQNWLNAKGTRELALKNNLQKWGAYILAGARKRIAETTVPLHKVPDPTSRRSKRVKEAEDIKQNYLFWTNKLSKY